MNDPIDEAKEQVSDALKARRGEPSEDAEEAARQVGELRGALTHDVEVLRSRLPEPSEVADRARTVGGLAVGGLAAGGLATVGALVLLLRRRAKRRSEEERVRGQALALARELARLDLDAEDVVDTGGRSVVRRLVLVLGAVAGVAGAVLLRQRLQGDDDTWDT